MQRSKRIFLLFTILVTTITTPGYADDLSRWRFGGYAGVSFANFTGPGNDDLNAPPESRAFLTPGLQVGAYHLRSLLRVVELSFHAGIQRSLKGAESLSDSGDVTYELSYLEAPLSVRLAYPLRKIRHLALYAESGMDVGYLLDATSNGADITQYVTTFNLSYHYAGGFIAPTLWPDWTLEFRVGQSRGLTNFDSLAPDSNATRHIATFALLGVSYQKHRTGKKHDPDGGGIVGAADRDGDGIADDIDRCPADAEDKNGIEDDDGCPDDGDGDGIKNDVDQCPDDAEDGDGYLDGDGCPEPEDVPGDRCPEELESKNDWLDFDGCSDNKPAPISKVITTRDGDKEAVAIDIVNMLLADTEIPGTGGGIQPLERLIDRESTSALVVVIYANKKPKQHLNAVQQHTFQQLQRRLDDILDGTMSGTSWLNQETSGQTNRTRIANHLVFQACQDDSLKPRALRIDISAAGTTSSPVSCSSPASSR